MEGGISCIADAVHEAEKRCAITNYSEHAQRTLLTSADVRACAFFLETMCLSSRSATIKTFLIDLQHTLGVSPRLRTFDPFSVVNRATAPLRSKPTVKR